MGQESCVGISHCCGNSQAGCWHSLMCVEVGVPWKTPYASVYGGRKAGQTSPVAVRCRRRVRWRRMRGVRKGEEEVESWAQVRNQTE